MSKTRGIIKKVAGPLVIAEGMRDANMYDVVRVSEQRLIGEVIEMHGDQASIQVYEETQGLGPGAPVESMEVPLSVELGPGLIGSIYDGIQRPLNKIMEVTNSNLLPRCGSSLPGPKPEMGLRSISRSRRACRSRRYHRNRTRDLSGRPEDHDPLRRFRYPERNQSRFFHSGRYDRNR